MTMTGSISREIRHGRIALRFHEDLIFPLLHDEAKLPRSLNKKLMLTGATDPVQLSSAQLRSDVGALCGPPFDVAFEEIRLPGLRHQSGEVASRDVDMVDAKVKRGRIQRFIE